MTKAVDVDIAPPMLQDQRSDITRLLATLKDVGYPADRIHLPVLGSLSHQLRNIKWSARMTLRRGEVVAKLPWQS